MAEKGAHPIFSAPDDGRTVRNPAGGLLTFKAGAADAFENFAGDAGMEVLGPPLAQTDPGA